MLFSTQANSRIIARPIFRPLLGATIWCVLGIFVSTSKAQQISLSDEPFTSSAQSVGNHDDGLRFSDETTSDRSRHFGDGNTASRSDFTDSRDVRHFSGGSQSTISSRQTDASLTQSQSQPQSQSPSRRGMLDQLRREPLVDMQSRRMPAQAYENEQVRGNRSPVAGANASMAVARPETPPSNPYRTGSRVAETVSSGLDGGYDNGYGRPQYTDRRFLESDRATNASYSAESRLTTDATNNNWLIEQHQQDSQSSANAESSGMSFIDREAQNGDSSGDAANAQMMRIAVNTVFVLSVAVGLILLAKQWFKLKQTGLVSKPQELAALKVIQVVPLSRSAALHLIEGSNHRFVVAMDSTGIKSVNVVHSSFSDELIGEDELQRQLQLADTNWSEDESDREGESKSEPSTRAERNRQRGSKVDAPASKNSNDSNFAARLKLHAEPEPIIEPTPDMDERLIRMLLNAKKAG